MEKQLSGHIARKSKRKNFLIQLLSACAFLFNCHFVYAQSLAAPPEISLEDSARVNLVSGYANIMQKDLSIGSGVGVLSHTIATYNDIFYGFNDDFRIETYPVVPQNGIPTRLVIVGHKSQSFRITSGNGINNFSTYEAVNGDGATLEQLGSGNSGVYKYTMKDGTIVQIGYRVLDPTVNYDSIIYPNGLTVKIYAPHGRIQSVTTNTGLQLKYNYSVNALTASSTDDDKDNYIHPSSIVAINNAIEYCDPVADTCTLKMNWPTVSYSWPSHAALFPPQGYPLGSSEFRVTDAMGRVTRYTHGLYSQNPNSIGWPYAARITGIVGPGISATYNYNNTVVCTRVTDIEPSYCTIVNANVVVSSTVQGVKCSYRYVLPDTPYVGEFIASDCANGNGTSAVQQDAASGVVTRGGPSSFYNNKIRLTLSSDDRRRVQTYSNMDDSFGYQYDARNNATHRTRVSTDGKVTLDIAVDFTPTCDSVNFRWCNKPIATRDPKGNQTDYDYWNESGAIKTITLPAPTANSPRPQTRYKYEKRYAYYLNAAGKFIADSNPVWVLTEENSCTDGAASGDGCADPSKLVVTRYDYGPASGPNNLWLRGIDKIDSLGKVLRTCYKYDNYGNTVSETLPKAGLTSCQ